MEFAIIQLLVFVLLASVDIGTAVYDRYWRHLDQNIGYVAHLAGAVAGMHLLLILFKSKVIYSNKADNQQFLIVNIHNTVKTPAPS